MPRLSFFYPFFLKNLNSELENILTLILFIKKAKNFWKN
jgi:hypothetical protein